MEIAQRNTLKHTNGVGEIRTHGTLSGSAVFKTAALNHSATTPSYCLYDADHPIARFEDRLDCPFRRRRELTNTRPQRQPVAQIRRLMTRKQMTIRGLWCVPLLLLPSQSSAQSGGPSRQHIDRAAALARLDEAVHYFHPVVATRATAWDSAFADNVQRILDAPNSAAYGRAVARLLASVDDAGTRVVSGAQTAWTGDWRPDSVLLVHATASGRNDASLALKLKRARAVVVDLRAGVDALPDALLARELLSGPSVAPGQRALQYSGFPSSGFQTSGGYALTWRTIAGERFEGASARDVPVSFLVDDQSVLPPVASAIRASGRGRLVGVNVKRVTSGGESYRVSMGEGITAMVRLAVRSAMATVSSDTTVSDAAVAADVAGRYAARGLTFAQALTATVAEAVDVPKMPPAPTDDAWTAAYPARGYRVLAASRVWSTIHLFYPYKALMGGSWDNALRTAIQDVERAGDAIAYTRQSRHSRRTSTTAM